MTERVIERVRMAKTIKDIYVAIPVEDNYMGLFRAVRATGIRPMVIDGDPTDLVRRYSIAADAVGADIVVRIPGDNPCLDPDEIDRMVEAYNDDPTRWNWLTTNLDRDVLDNGYPGGLGCEIYDVRLLHWLNRTVVEPRLREHPHRWAFENQKVRTIQAPDAIRRPDLDFSVNTMDDYNYIHTIYSALYFANPEFRTRDILSYLN